MSDFKGTPGEWAVDGHRLVQWSDREVLDFHEKGIGPIAFPSICEGSFGDFISREQMKANLTLMSASKQLLAALQLCVEQFDLDYLDSMELKAISAAHDAIAKALGEQQ